MKTVVDDKIIRIVIPFSVVLDGESIEPDRVRCLWSSHKNTHWNIKWKNGKSTPVRLLNKQEKVQPDMEFRLKRIR